MDFSAGSLISLGISVLFSHFPAYWLSVYVADRVEIFKFLFTLGGYVTYDQSRLIGDALVIGSNLYMMMTPKTLSSASNAKQ